MQLTEGRDTAPRATIRTAEVPKESIDALEVVMRTCAPLPQGEAFRTLPVQRASGAVPEDPTGKSAPFIGHGEGTRLVRQAGLDRAVLLKVPASPEVDPDGPAALVREARIIGALDHPNVPPVHALERDDEGLPYLLMAAITGQPWSRRLRRDGLPEGDALDRHLEILLEICHAVRFAHSRSILHLDLKPGNVVLGEHGQVYLAGWTLARRQEELLDADYIPLGTPTYMAPEILDPRLEISERTDVYGLGGMLYQILSGWSPHGSPSDQVDVDAETDLDRGVDAVLDRVRLGQVSSLAVDAQPELASVAMRALERDPARRFENALAFEQALTEAMRRRSARSVRERARELLSRLEQLTTQWRDGTTDDTTEREIQGVFSACRFAFEQTLRDWPDQYIARAGLERCLVLMAHHDLDAGSLESAQALVAKLEAPPAPLMARVRELRARRETAANAGRRLTEARRSARLPGESYERSLGALAFGVLTAVGLVAMPRLGPPPALLALVASCFGAFIGTATAWIFREHYRDSHFNRLALRVQNLIFASVAVMAGLTLRLGLDEVFLFIGASLIGASGAALLATTIAPFLWSGVVTGVGTAFAVVLMPEWGFEILAVGLLGAQSYLAWRVRPGAVLAKELDRDGN